MIQNEYITINLYKNIKYYEDLGYEIPKNSKGQVPRGSTILIKTLDLPRSSSLSIPCICDECGISFSVQFKNLIKTFNKYNKTYCKNCIQKGIRNPSWKDGSQIKEQRLDKGFREKVLKRDNYLCQKCGAVANIAHHLNGYNWDIENRTNVSNGASLCYSCHTNFHNLYGYGNNTKQQYLEWLKSDNDNLIQKTRQNNNCSLVYCFETNEVKTAFDFAKELQCRPNCIWNCCNLRQKSTHGRHFLYKNKYDTMSQKDIDEFLTWANTKGA